MILRQWSLRGMLALTLLTAVCLSAWRTLENGKARMDDQIREFEELRARVGTEVGGPKWLPLAARYSRRIVSVDLASVYKEDRDAAIALTAACPHLRVLTPGPYGLSSSSLASLQCLKDLQELDIQGSELRGEDLRIISGFRHLRKLSLEVNDNEECRDEDVLHLGVLSELEELWLSVLTFSDQAPSDEAMSILKGKTKLRRLGIWGNKLTTRSLGFLSDCRSLDELHMPGLEHAEGANTKFPKLECLTDLDLSRSDLSNVALDELGNCPGLAVLRLGRTNVNRSGLGFLGALKQLEVLDLRGLTLDNKCLGYLRTMTKLRILDLRACRVEGLPTNTFGECRHLSRLRLSACEGMRDQDFRSSGIALLNGLEVLMVRDTPLTDAAFEGMDGLQSLEYLDLRGTAVTQAVVQHLRKAPRLRFVWFSEPVGNEPAVVKFIAGLPDAGTPAMLKSSRDLDE